MRSGAGRQGLQQGAHSSRRRSERDTRPSLFPVAHIDKIPPQDATGALRREYDGAIRRAGRIWEIVAVQSQNGESLRHSMRLYGQVMFRDSPLTRAQREMIAVVTSQVNECHY